jgi:K+-sensing histidine kinase KdpD
MLGHDLKNPLGPLITLLPLAEEEAQDLEVKEILGVATRNVQKLREMLYKTLELAKRNELGMKLEVEEIRLREIVQNILEEKQILFQDDNMEEYQL